MRASTSALLRDRGGKAAATLTRRTRSVIGHPPEVGVGATECGSSTTNVYHDPGIHQYVHLLSCARLRSGYNGLMPSHDELRQMVLPYEGADDVRAWTALATSVPPYAFCWWLMWRALDVSYGLTLVLALPTAGFLVRTFIVQHDCGHGSFFRSARLRIWV